MLRLSLYPEEERGWWLKTWFLEVDWARLWAMLLPFPLLV
jgi:hypothetical protein